MSRLAQCVRLVPSSPSFALKKTEKDLQHLCGGGERPLVVLDGGIASAGNLEYLKEHGFDYVVNGKRTTRRRFSADFLEIERFHTEEI